ncbi:type VII secretion protein EccCa [Tsukamurella tyrosinosolvens]|uniref:type VII secretion protein EccCa n=1 Tax=Tsukamurella tyrosinosolvens TaxID=57704 RepID=UPI001AFB27E0|nr:type VII secretion protein EccCa [Tsukamurella tyrosinosolvens]QRY84573.1 type VII secretion protein EccCa [Tsukamurella tyrosinosolvens]
MADTTDVVFEPVTEGFARKQRLAPPRTPGGEVALQAPPEIPRAVPGGLLGKLLPVVMVVAVIGMIALMFTSGSAMMQSPFMMMFPIMMLMSMFGMYGMNNRGNGATAAELNEDRKDYLRYLGQIRSQVDRTRTEQRAALEWIHPDPAALPGCVGSRRMWERRPADPDFLHVRVGVGSQRLATRLVPPETGPLEDLEPVSTVALRRFVRHGASVPGLPVAVALRGFPAVGLSGPRAEVFDTARAMLLALAALHGPDHVRIVVATPDVDSAEWGWLKWLPHVAHPTECDSLGPVRTVYGSASELEDAIAPELADRGPFARSAPVDPTRTHYVILLDRGIAVTPGGALDAVVGIDGVTVLDLSPEPDALAVRSGLQLVIDDARRLGARSAAGVEYFAQPDAVTAGAAQVTARRIGRFRPASMAELLDFDGDAGATDPGLPALIGIADAAAITPETVWRERTARERLRVPIGVGPRGEPVEIDLKEAAENGMGPHGLCIGATGSGKSEFLRTLVLSMVATHPPEALNLVLVDFKGGATFLGLESLHHVAAVITNLEEEIAMVDRMRDALSGEMNRRQEVLRRAGNFANVGEYEKARRAGAPLEPMPALVVIVDEFSELLSQKPDFAELFVAIGRLGRSLHIHLLLASQRLEEGKLRGLDSHLSYRIGLKTFSASESRAVLGVPDAYHLPSTPGAGFLKFDADPPRRFHASYVSGEYEPPSSAASTVRRGTVGSAAVREYLNAPAPIERRRSPGLPEGLMRIPAQPGDPVPPIGAPGASAPGMGAPSLLQTMVARLAGYGLPAHEVWLPPLDESAPVGELAQHLRRTDSTPLRVAIGVVDRPYDQRRDLLVVDLNGAQGNVAVVGGPQSGKSTALRTLIVSTALTHTPRQAQFYVLDFGGGSLASIAGVPHVGSVAGRLDPDRVRRTVAEVTGVIRRREAAFREHGVASMDQYRAHPAAAADPFGDVFLVIDGWQVLRSEFESLEPQVNAIAAQGLSYGVHLVIAASRWGEVRPAVKDQLGTRIELRLGDPMDSEMGRRVASSVPVGRPGRGITGEQLHMLVALPCGTDSEDLPAAQEALVAEIGERYADHAPEVRMLPDVVLRDRIPARRDASPTHAVFGVGESELAAATLQFESQPFFLVLGDSECGKTETLRTIIAALVAGGTPKQTKIVLVDYRRTLLGVIESDHLAGYASSSDALTPMVDHLVRVLRERCPGADVTPQQLKERSWWTGPDIYLIVDDYDLVASAAGNPLAPLLELLPQARDIGLKVIIARRSGGLARGLYESFLARIRDLAADGLVMSGSREEGTVLGAVKMSPQPPGRGTWVSRARGVELVQVALVAEPEGVSGPDAP